MYVYIYASSLPHRNFEKRNYVVKVQGTLHDHVDYPLTNQPAALYI
jgi:hypothetical protein